MKTKALITVAFLFGFQTINAQGLWGKTESQKQPPLVKKTGTLQGKEKPPPKPQAKKVEFEESGLASKVADVKVHTRPRRVSDNKLKQSSIPTQPKPRPKIKNVVAVYPPTSRDPSYDRRPVWAFEVVGDDARQAIANYLPANQIKNATSLYAAGWRVIVYPEVKLTAYDNCSKCTGGGKGLAACSVRTKGQRIAAVDRRYIPYGSLAYFKGRHPVRGKEYGWAWAVDRCGECNRVGDNGKIQVDLYYDLPHKSNIHYGNQSQRNLVVLVPPTLMAPSDDPEFYNEMPKVVKQLAGANGTEGLKAKLSAANAYKPKNKKVASDDDDF